MGVSLILFHGGVGISLRVLSRVGVGLGLLALPGVLITTVIVALVVAPIFGVAFPVALIIGAVLASTDPAILIPLFDRLNIPPKVSQMLISESGFNDTTGAVLTGALESGRFTLSGPALEFFKELAISTFIGLLAGLILCYVIASTKRTGIWDEAPGVVILAVVALAYFSNEYVGGSGYLAAFVMGLMVGNMRDLGFAGQYEEHERLLEGFVGQVSEIATLLVFVTLGMNLPFHALEK
jgi:cell volume regulation protein A